MTQRYLAIGLAAFLGIEPILTHAPTADVLAIENGRRDYFRQALAPRAALLRPDPGLLRDISQFTPHFHGSFDLRFVREEPLKLLHPDTKPIDSNPRWTHVEILRIISGDLSGLDEGTGFVVGEDDDHYYVLTNTHVWGWSAYLDEAMSEPLTFIARCEFADLTVGKLKKGKDRWRRAVFEHPDNIPKGPTTIQAVSKGIRGIARAAVFINDGLFPLIDFGGGSSGSPLFNAAGFVIGIYKGYMWQIAVKEVLAFLDQQKIPGILRNRLHSAA